jgi:hypothetical protein
MIRERYRNSSNFQRNPPHNLPVLPRSRSWPKRSRRTAPLLTASTNYDTVTDWGPTLSKSNVPYTATRTKALVVTAITWSAACRCAAPIESRDTLPKIGTPRLRN